MSTHVKSSIYGTCILQLAPMKAIKVIIAILMGDYINQKWVTVNVLKLRTLKINYFFRC